MPEPANEWQLILKEKEFNDLLMEWNGKINLVSRKKNDVFDLIKESKIFFEKIEFKEGIRILDLGTGGGFPGIVIALHHPEAQLTLVDSIGKKIKVVDDIIKKLELKNVTAVCSRAEDLSPLPLYKYKYDYVVARSVAVLQDLAFWSRNFLKIGGKLITLKGGEIGGEIKAAEKLKYVKYIDEYDRGERKIIVIEIK